MVLAQAQQVVVPRVQAYRERAAAARRSTPVLDHAAVASLQRNIDRLLHQWRLGAANRLLDRLQATLLQTEAVSPELALTLEGVRAQVAKLFPSAGDRDTFSEAQLQQAQASAPLSLPAGFIGTILLPTLNRGGSGSGVSGWTNAFILDVFAGGTDIRGTGVDLLTDLCNKMMLAGQMRSPLALWLLSRLVLIPKPPDPSAASTTPSTPVQSITLRPLSWSSGNLVSPRRASSGSTRGAPRGPHHGTCPAGSGYSKWMSDWCARRAMCLRC